MPSLLSCFLLLRPKTLPAALVPVGIGCLAAWKLTGAWHPILAVWTALSALCIQIATNVFNDALDCEKEADTTNRQGPKRMSASGALSVYTVYLIGWIFVILASACALPLIQVGGLPVLIVGVISLYFTYGYTGGPLPLAYKGLGELFVLLFFGLVAVLGSTYLQVVGNVLSVLPYLKSALPLGFQCGLLSCFIIEVNNIRDRKEDEQTGKRTLAVRWGDAKARRLAMSFVLATYALLPLTLRQFGLSLSAYWLLPLALGLFLCFKIKRTKANKKMNALLALASFHLILFFLTLWLAFASAA